mmetsp:Transcript_98946/g.277136  ORF Transcript_98946/g.277136 Transcript_98946/m.277136 type:complete len:336 (+) Transcript_98946:1252-2259(+)
MHEGPRQRCMAIHWRLQDSLQLGGGQRLEQSPQRRDVNLLRGEQELEGLLVPPPSFAARPPPPLLGGGLGCGLRGIRRYAVSRNFGGTCRIGVLKLWANANLGLGAICIQGLVLRRELLGHEDVHGLPRHCRGPVETPGRALIEHDVAVRLGVLADLLIVPQQGRRLRVLQADDPGALLLAIDLLCGVVDQHPQQELLGPCAQAVQVLPGRFRAGTLPRTQSHRLPLLPQGFDGAAADGSRILGHALLGHLLHYLAALAVVAVDGVHRGGAADLVQAIVGVPSSTSHGLRQLPRLRRGSGAGGRPRLLRRPRRLGGRRGPRRHLLRLPRMVLAPR